MTRGEIEEVRGVTVSTNIIRSLLEREWVRVVGHRDVPGRPAMFGTTKSFLDYFGLKKLDDLPPLADLADWESLRVQLNLPAVEEDELQELSPPEATELPVLFPIDEEETEDVSDDEVADALAVIERGIPDIESALSAETEIEEAAQNIDDDESDKNSEDDVEPIEATEWPDPNENNTVIQSLDADDEAGDDDADIDRADASVTNA